MRERARLHYATHTQKSAYVCTHARTHARTHAQRMRPTPLAFYVCMRACAPCMHAYMHACILAAMRASAVEWGAPAQRWAPPQQRVQARASAFACTFMPACAHPRMTNGVAPAQHCGNGEVLAVGGVGCNRRLHEVAYIIIIIFLLFLYHYIIVIIIIIIIINNIIIIATDDI